MIHSFNNKQSILLFSICFKCILNCPSIPEKFQKYIGARVQLTNCRSRKLISNSILISVCILLNSHLIIMSEAEIIQFSSMF